MSKRNTWVDGERVHPVMRGFRIECCTCGAVHVLNFRTDLSFTVRRDKRATAAVRRKAKPHVKRT